MNLPNFLSIARMFLAPWIIFFLSHENKVGAIFFMFLVAFTDWLDGFIAKTKGDVTELGKILDPIADKFAIGIVVIYLAVKEVFPVWLLSIILLRDISILIGGGILWKRKGKVIPSNFFGKIAFHFTAATVLVYAMEWKMFQLFFSIITMSILFLSWVSYGLIFIRK